MSKLGEIIRRAQRKEAHEDIATLIRLHIEELEALDSADDNEDKIEALKQFQRYHERLA